MNFEEFNRQINVISGEESRQIRDKYTRKFVDVSSQRYRDTIATLIPFDDGFYYVGYLWDCLKLSTVITEQKALEMLKHKNQKVYVFWDLHSAKMIPMENYWKFPRDAILYLTVSNLILGLTFLPGDIYIFDNNYDWSLILTHENIDGNRWCLEARSTPEK